MQKNTQGKIRIIGGQWRGRKILVADEQGLRPTGDRIRETVFNWLQPVIAGADCLDPFAGTGSLSYEALSRGADSSTLLEQNSSLVSVLNKNKKTLGAETATIENTDALAWLRQCHQRFDLIFLDPPFGQNLVEPACQLIRDNNCLKTDGLVYIESERKQDDPQGFEMYKQKTTGQVQYGLYTMIP